MKSVAIALIFCVLTQHCLAFDEDGCTAILVGKKASSTGSPMTTHTNDCAECDTRVAFVPPQDFPEGAARPVYLSRAEFPRYVGFERGVRDYFPKEGQKETIPIGYIPQVRHTYGYYESSYGLMNEHQLGMGESTCSAKLWSYAKTQGGQALLDIGTLGRLGLERAKTAREAIKIMGDLAQKYGFYGETLTGRILSGSAGETLTIVDPNEAWVFHILSDGKTGAVWAAARVPDNAVAVVPNAFIIREVDLKKPDWFMASDNMFDVALENGFWDGKSPFDFTMAFAPEEPSLPKYSWLRTWRVFDLVAPSLGLKPQGNDVTDFPFAVKPDTPVSPRRLMEIQGDHYEGSEYDMTKGLMAGPFGNPNRREGGLGGKLVDGELGRAISIQRTAYATVISPDANSPRSIGGIVWFGTDAPHSSVFVPFFTAATAIPESYTRGSAHKFDRTSAWWAFDFLANWAELSWSSMIADITEEKFKLQDELFSKVDTVKEQARHAIQNNAQAISELLNNFQTTEAERIVAHWWNFSDFMVMKYNDGFLNYPLVGRTVGYPAWWLRSVGYDHDPRPKWINGVKDDDIKVKSVVNEANAPALSAAQEGVHVGIVVATLFVVGILCGFVGHTYGSRKYSPTMF